MGFRRLFPPRSALPCLRVGGRGRGARRDNLSPSGTGTLPDHAAHCASPATNEPKVTQQPVYHELEPPPAMPEGWLSRLLRTTAVFWIAPLAVYFLGFTALTWPLIENFHTHWFADAGDGLQNYWNLWWVDKAVTDLHQLPWHTRWLHYPDGALMLAQTMNSFNGFVGIPLLRFMSLTELYNVIVIFSFVVGGLTAFWLAHDVTGRYWGSLLGGWVFTFSAHHWAHAQGHMQMTSLEWIPLFVMLWRRMLLQPRPVTAVAAAVALLYVTLCDYYYFFYCVLAAGVMSLWATWHLPRLVIGFRTDYWPSVRAFLLTSAATWGMLVGSLLVSSVLDPFTFGHPPGLFSLDLPALVIPGGHWRFQELTAGYWRQLPAVPHEHSVHLGVGLIALLICHVVLRRRAPDPERWMWYAILLVFVVLAMGPTLHWWGRDYAHIRLPYGVLEKLFPPLQMGGVPVRMMVMVTLAAGVLAAEAVGRVWELDGRRKLWVAPILSALILEHIPASLTVTRIVPAQYVQFLRKLPGEEGVLDLTNEEAPALNLFNQTVHEKPIAFGYITRYPRSVKRRGNRLLRAISDQAWDRLYRDFRLRWLVLEPGRKLETRYPGVRVVYRDRVAEVYDLRRAMPGAGRPKKTPPSRQPSRSADPSP